MTLTFHTSEQHMNDLAKWRENHIYDLVQCIMGYSRYAACVLCLLSDYKKEEIRSMDLINGFGARGYSSHGIYTPPNSPFIAFIGVETAALTFRTKQYSTSYSSHICYGKRFYNDFFLNHNTTALVRNCLKLLSCVVIETALDGMKRINYFNSLLSTRKRTI